MFFSQTSSMSWKVSRATLNDVPAITSIYSHDELTPFIELCLGSLNILALNFNQAARIAENLQDPEQAWFVARDEHNKIVGFAEWGMPKAEADDEEDMAEELVCAAWLPMSGSKNDTWNERKPCGGVQTSSYEAPQ
jgi:hypothetical protein